MDDNGQGAGNSSVRLSDIRSPAAGRSHPKTGMTNGLGGRTNGMTNGLGGKTNGLTNGMGGRTNGMTNGLTNGIGGMTNGLEGSSISRRNRLDDRAISPSRISLVLIVAFIIMVPASFFFLAYDDPVYTGIRVDGSFDDWNESLIFTDGNAYPDAGLNIVEYSADTNDAGNLFVYARAGGAWFSTSNADSLFAFIDADANPATGYAIDGSGAEYAIEIYGWDSQIRGRQFGMFSGQDPGNWSAWNWRSATAQISGDRMEIGIPGAGISLADGYTLTFMTKRGDAIADFCDAVISPGRGALVVLQISQDTGGIISQDNVMSIELTASGSAVDVTGITFDSNVGTPTVTGLPAQVPAGQTVTLQVSVPVSTQADGSLVAVSVSGVTCSGTSRILGTGLAAYANAPPANISIDGAFGDWNAISKASDQAGDAANPDIDIAEYAAVNSTARASFYLKVGDSGTMLGGSNVPGARVKPQASSGTGNGSSGSSSPAPLKRVGGEDMTRIYIDSQNGGQNINGIAADYLIEIKGRNGHITSKKLFSLPGMSFVKDVDAGNRGPELEVGIPTADIGMTGNLTYFMESTDWQGETDGTDVQTSSPVPSGTRSGENENTADGFGSPVAFCVDATLYNSAVYDPVAGKIVIAYRDGGDSGRGKAVVGTVNGNLISFGTPTVFAPGALGVTWVAATFDSVNNKVVIAFRNSTDAGHGTAIVGTVSGTDITFGSPAVFLGSAAANQISATFDSDSGKAVILYQDSTSGNNYGTAVVGTVSGTDITFGTPAVFESAETTYISSAFDSVNNKVIVSYRDVGGSNAGTSVVGTVSGTDISFGTPAVFASSGSTCTSTVFDSANGKAVISYTDTSNSFYGTAVVGTVSGTDISFGSPAVFNTGSTQYISAAVNSTSGQIIISYTDAGNSNMGTAVIASVIGTDISFGAEETFSSGGTSYVTSVFDQASNKMVIAYQETGATAGAAVVMVPEFQYILLPILAIMGLVFALGRKKEESESGDDSQEKDETESSEPPKEIKHTLLIIGILMLMAGFIGVVGLRLGFIQAILGNSDPYPGIGSAEPMGHVVSMVPFVLGLVTVAFWGIRNDPVYREIERRKKETAEDSEDIFADVPDEEEPEVEDEEFEWEVTQDTVPEEFKEPLPEPATTPEPAPAKPQPVKDVRPDPAKAAPPKPAEVQKVDLQEMKRKQAQEDEQVRIQRCEKMLSVAVVLPDDKERLRKLIHSGISLKDFTDEVKKAVEKRKKKEEEKNATADEKAAILEDTLVAELEELGEELDSGFDSDAALEDQIMKELEDLDDL